ncbi:MAG: hypothetical protein NVS2B16_04590 [Chloroflexota bacterium]
MAHLSPANAEFVIISFEGPDEYARAGGLAVRVRDLSEAVSSMGFRTHLFFFGDPSLPAVEQQGRLTLHRWGQWISAYHPEGVYDGEWGRIQDMRSSLPAFLAEQIVRPAAEQGRVTVLMGEDWQTVDTMIATSSVLSQRNLLKHAIPVWTANNTFGFEGIDWPTLSAAAAPMTVSRYMKHQTWQYDVNPLVVPNGLAPASLVDVDAKLARKLRQSFDSDIALFKIGRFSPDKRWIMALEAVGLLNRMGTRTRILIRGDRSAHGQEALARARHVGLVVEDLKDRYSGADDLASAIEARPHVDVLNLTSFLPDDLLPVLYSAVDGVLANSGHEPFGLVGLEVMGAGGLAFVGSTGEEYAQADRNAVVLDTDDPREIVIQVQRLRETGEQIREIKRRGKKTARRYLWPEVLRELLTKLEYVALARGVEVPA